LVIVVDSISFQLPITQLPISVRERVGDVVGVGAGVGEQALRVRYAGL